jgi:hypothetical protein
VPAAPQHRLLSGLAALALTGGVLIAPALLAPTAASAQTADPSDQQVAEAAEWLAGQLSEEGTLTGSFPDGEGGTIEYTDWGRSLDSALALLAAGGHDDTLGRTLASVEEPDAVAEYTQGAPGDADDAAYVGATAKLATVVELTGGDATDVGGVDLLAQLRGLAQPSGRYADSSDWGDYANLLGHSFALLAFDAAGQAQPAGTVAGLLAAQCLDGGFPVTYEPTDAAAGCSSGPDSTGLVLQALAAVGEGDSVAAQEAVDWLLAQQQSDGSFPGEAAVNSTGYALLGLNAVGEPNAAAAAWLSDQQNPDGGLGKGDGGASDFYATAQALTGWSGTTFPGSARTVARAVAVPVDPTPTPTPTPSTPAPVDPTPTGPATPTPDAGSPAPTPTLGAGSGDSGGVLGAGTGTGGTGSTGGTGGSGATSSGGALPRTGSDTGTLVSAGLALLAAGAGLLVAGASRRGRARTSR